MTPSNAAPEISDPAADDAATLHARTGAQVAALRHSFATGTTIPVDARLAQLAALQSGLRAERESLLRALAADLGKSRTESAITEIGAVLQELTHVRKNLRRWLAPERFSPGAMLAPVTGHMLREPLGTVLIIAPWNYPVNLTLSPLIGAIAGGNTVVVKPSEVAPATSSAIAQLIRTHLDPSWVQVVEGAVPETAALLEQRFDLIFYTGNGSVGRVIARAAAEHLTPTVLELGGKSPVFVDEDVDLAATARRIVWGKFTNTGQTCVAPDYLMATETTATRLLPHLTRAIGDLYGKDPRRSRDYGRVITRRHFDRIAALIDEELVVHGGLAHADREQKYLPPTIMAPVPFEHRVMGEEIFGPVLPLLTVDGPDEAIRRIRERDKPLTAYVFTGSRAVEQRFAAETSSGSLAVGMTLAHVGSVTMPFGGVGESGMGAYHGRASLEAFTHAKPVVRKPLRPDTLRIIHPPFGALRRRVLPRLLGPC